MSIENHPSGLAYSLRRRRNASDNSSRNQSETPEVNLRPHVPKRTPRSISRFKDAESPLENSPSTEPRQAPIKRKRDFEPLSPSDSYPLKRAKADVPVKMEEGSMTVNEELMKMEESVSFNVEVRLSPSPPSSSVRSRPASSRSSPSEGATSTDATSVDEETIIVEMKPISLIMAKLKRVKGSKHAVPLEQEKPNHSVLPSSSEVSKNPAIAVTDCGTPNSEPASPMTITSTSGIKRKRKLPRPSTDLDHAPAVRVHGDYVLTPALLGEPESAWINCKICEEPFVQKDAYYTRSSCPRCERHSKLYGYMWPKTDREGKHDTEERVLDHRTVHRFIRPSEERTIRRRDRSSTGSRAVTREGSEVVLEKSEVLGRRGGRRMARIIV
jgi:[histone H4]-N-methyl-L-lysine20 N-methyltransferase